MVDTFKSIKAERIKSTLRTTRERRKGQTCHVYNLKVDKSSLSPKLCIEIPRLFMEARWFYNAALSSENYRTFDTKVREVNVFVKDHFEVRELTVLSSQMKQSIISRIGDAIHALAVKKAKGFKVGALKFRYIIESVPLKQFGVTYRIVDRSHVAIQGLSGPIRVFGIDQFDDAEIANAHFLQRGGDYYLHVTTYRDRAEEPEKPFGNVGIDFNIEAGCQLVFHNGVALGFDERSDTDPRIKGLQRKLARQDRTNKKKEEALNLPAPKPEKKKKKKGKKAKPVHTKNRTKTRNKIKKAYEPHNNRKQNIRNQIVRVLRDRFKTIHFQDETLSGWQRLWGKRIHGTAPGGIIAQLKQLPTTRVVKKFVATTKTCHVCLCKNQVLTLNTKWWTCEFCGTRHNRHVNAASNMPPRLEQSSTSEERSSSACSLMEAFSKLSSIGIRVRLLVEPDTSPVRTGEATVL